MVVIVTYSPEMNIWKIETSSREILIAESQFAPGTKYANLAPLFEQVKAGKLSGESPIGLTVAI